MSNAATAFVSPMTKNVTATLTAGTNRTNPTVQALHVTSPNSDVPTAKSASPNSRNATTERSAQMDPTRTTAVSRVMKSGLFFLLYSFFLCPKRLHSTLK